MGRPSAKNWPCGSTAWARHRRIRWSPTNNFIRGPCSKHERCKSLHLKSFLGRTCPSTLPHPIHLGFVHPQFLSSPKKISDLALACPLEVWRPDLRPFIGQGTREEGGFVLSDHACKSPFPCKSHSLGVLPEDLQERPLQFQHGSSWRPFCMRSWQQNAKTTSLGQDFVRGVIQ